MQSSARALVAVVTLGLLSLGCGDGSGIKCAPVSGIITYNDKPVSGALVIFSREGVPRVGSGMTDAEGNFRLTTVNTDDGAPIGDCIVTISKTTVSAEAKQMGPEGYAKMMGEKFGGKSSSDFKTKGEKITGLPITVGGSELPAKFADPQKSGLRRTVVDGSNSFKIDLKD